MSACRLLVSAAALLPCAASAMAAECDVAVAVPAPEMYVAAPEMRAALVAPTPACTLAQEVIARARTEARAITAGATQATPATGPSAAGYVPKTQYDNTPWRFDMNQNGKRMTAEEFDAWMKAKGIRVATGKPSTMAPAAATPPDASAQSSGASTP